MAQPTLSQVHVSQPLTNLSIAYIQDDKNFIADKVFPTLPVIKQTDRYFTYLRDAFFRSDVEERAAGAESAGTGYELDNSQTYYCRVYAIHDDVPDQIRDNSDSVLQPDADATYLISEQLMIYRETIWITNFFKSTSGWTTTQTGVTGSPSTNQFLRWDQAGSTPIEDIRTQVLLQAQLTGKKPNTLVLGPLVFNQLINNPEVVDRVKYTSKEPVSMDLLARLLDVDRVLVPLATQNTAQEPATPLVDGSTLTMAFMYGKTALLCYAEPNPGLRKASAGYTFGWKGYLGGTANIAISKFRMQQLKADRIEGEMSFDLKMVAPDMGTIFLAAIS